MKIRREEGGCKRRGLYTQRPEEECGVTLQLPRGSPIRGHQALEVFLPKDPSQPHPLARQWGPDLHPVLQDHHHPQTPPHFTLPSQIQHFRMQTLSHLSKLRSPPIVPSALGINTGSWLGPQTTPAKSQAPMTPPCQPRTAHVCLQGFADTAFPSSSSYIIF